MSHHSDASVAILGRSMRVTESQFQQRVIDYATLMGWRIFHPLPAKRGNGKVATWQQGHTGYPDLTLARNGVVILAELKRDKGYPTPEQKKWAAAIGAQHRLWRPKDWNEIVKELAK